MKVINHRSILFLLPILAGLVFFSSAEKVYAVSFSTSKSTVIANGLDSFTLTASGFSAGQSAELWFDNGSGAASGGTFCGSGPCSNSYTASAAEIGRTYTYWVVVNGVSSNTVTVSFVAPPPPPLPPPIVVSGFGGSYSCVDGWSMNITGPPNKEVYIHYTGSSLGGAVNETFPLTTLDSSGNRSVSSSFLCSNVNIGTFSGNLQWSDGSNPSNTFSWSVGRFALTGAGGLQDLIKGNTGLSGFNITTDIYSTGVPGPSFSHSITYNCSVSPAIKGGSCSFSPSSGTGAPAGAVVRLSTSGATISQIYTVTVSADMSGPGGPSPYSKTLAPTIGSIRFNVIEPRIVITAVSGISSADCGADLINCNNQIEVKLKKIRGASTWIFGEPGCAINQACNFSDVAEVGDRYEEVCPAVGSQATIYGTKYIQNTLDFENITIKAGDPPVIVFNCIYKTVEDYENYDYSGANVVADSVLMDSIDINTWQQPQVSWIGPAGPGSCQTNCDLGANIFVPGNWDFTFRSAPQSNKYYLISYVHTSFSVIQGTPRNGLFSSDVYTPYTVNFSDGSVASAWKKVTASGATSWWSSVIRISGYYKPYGSINVSISGPGSGSNYSINVSGDGNNLTQAGKSASFNQLSLGGIPGWTTYTVSCDRNGWPSVGGTVNLRDVNEDPRVSPFTSAKAGNVTCDFSSQVPVPSGETLTITKSGSGSGTVTSNPAGISCGATCSASYANGTSVSLTATASGSSSFVGWSGEGCSGTGTCTVTMSQVRNVTATFGGSNTLTLTAAPSCSPLNIFPQGQPRVELSWNTLFPGGNNRIIRQFVEIGTTPNSPYTDTLSPASSGSTFRYWIFQYDPVEDVWVRSNTTAPVTIPWCAGDAVVNATLNGNPWTAGNSSPQARFTMQFAPKTLGNPVDVYGFSYPVTLSNLLGGGTWTIVNSPSSVPPGATLSSVTPTSTQTMPTNQATMPTLTYTLNFTSASSCPNGNPANSFEACVYTGTNLTTYNSTFTESSINHNYGSGGPNGLTNTYSIRWKGRFNTFGNATYRFTTLSDDGVRLYVDGSLVIDNWVNQAPTTKTADLAMTTGDHDIVLEYYEFEAGAVINLSWTALGAPNQPPLALASISKNGSSYAASITVTRGVVTPVYLSASGSSDPDGWTDSQNGVSTGGGKCEWNRDLNQGAPTFEPPAINNPATPSACNISLGNLTFNDTPGTYTYQVLRITDKKGAESNVASVQVTVADTIPPASSNLQSDNTSSCGQITLTWTDNSSNEDGFRIWRYPATGFPGNPNQSYGGNTYRLVRTLPANAVSYVSGSGTDNPTPGSSYYYIVTSFNSAGDSAVTSQNAEGPVAVIVCAPNMSGSSKVVDTVNGSPYIGQTLRNADIIGFKVIIRNNGTSPAYNVYVVDTLSANLLYQSNARLDIDGPAGNAPANIPCSQAGQVITCNSAQNLGDKPAGSPDWVLTFSAKINSTSSSQPAGFFGNTARIRYGITDGGPADQTATVTTGLVPFRTRIGIPEIREVAP